MKLIITLVLATCLVRHAVAEKIYINPSDQIHNISPDQTYCEAVAMKDVAQKLAAKLSAGGFEVQNSDGGTMSQATTGANAWPADIFISLHSNARGGSGWGEPHGTLALYYQPRDESAPNPISIELAQRCMDKCVEKYITHGVGHAFGVRADLPFLNFNLYVLRKTEMPGTLVEGLFHDNEADTAALKTEEGRDAYAQGVYEAICDHFGKAYYPDAPILDPIGPVGNDADGLLALVICDEKGRVLCIRQTGLNAAWPGEWLDLEGSIECEPVIARNAQGRLQVFARSYGDRIWHKVQASKGIDRWNGWYDLGGHASGDPAAGIDGDGRLVVFAVGTDGYLRYSVQRSVNSAIQWGEWVDLGGPCVGIPAVSRDADGQLVVACRTPENGLIVATQSGDEWTVWNNRDDVVAGNPIQVRDREDRMALFCLGPDGHVLCRTETTWQDLGGSFVGGPVVGVSADGRLEVFARDHQGAVSHSFQESDGEWTGWQALSGDFAGGPMVARNRDGRIELFGRTNEGCVQYRVQREPAKSAIWDGWYALGGAQQ